MSELRVLNDVIGLKTNGNPYILPSGSAMIAQNFETVRPNVYRKCRGRKAYLTSITDTSSIIKQWLEYKDKLWLHQANNTISVDNGSGAFSIISDYLGSSTFIAPDSTTLIQYAKSNGNIYFTTSKGVYKSDNVLVRPVGIDRPNVIDLTLVDTTGAFLSNNNYVSYRIVFYYYDDNENKIVSEVSPRIDVLNDSGGTRAVQVRFFLPSTIKATNYYGIYRSSQQTTIPPEDYQLVKEAVITSADITKTYIEVLDIQPDSLKGSQLYTNTTQETIAGTNTRPPLAKTIDRFRNYMFYANTVNRYRLDSALTSVSEISVGDSLVISDGVTTITMTAMDAALYAGGDITNCTASTSLIEVTTTNPHGLSTGDYVAIVGVTGTTEANGIWKITSTGPGTFTLNGSVFVNAYINGGQVSLYEDYDSNPRFLLYTAGTDSDNITNTTQSILKTLNLCTSNTKWYGYYDSGANDLPGLFHIENREFGGTAFYLTSSNMGTAFSPNVPTSGSAYIATAETLQNALYVSKPDQPEASNTRYLVGNQDDPIIKVVGLRDSLFIIKQNDGVYRLSGDSLTNFVIDEFNGTVKCTQPNSIAKGDNSIFLFTSLGFMNISDNGVSLIDIDNEFRDLRVTKSTNFTYDGYGWYNQQEKSYYIATHNASTSTSPDIIKVYNTYTESWSERVYGVYTNDIYCKGGIVINDLQYYIPVTGTGVLVERKDFLATDFASPDISITISSIDTTTNTITISSAVTIKVGAIVTKGTVSRYVTAITDTTHLVLNGVTGLTTGAATITQGIDSVLLYQQVHFGAPDYEKEYQKAIVYFDNDETLISNVKILTATDLVTTYETTEMSNSTVGWGGFPWGSVQWGQKTATDKLIIYIPKQHTRGASLYFKIEHDYPNEQIAICGFSVIGELVDTRIRR